jgi:hypothetical protein
VSGVLLHNLLHFGRLLHDLGLDVPAGRMTDAARALDFVELGRRTDVHVALRSVLVHRPRDLALFDAAFALFWRPPPESRAGAGLQPMRRPPSAGPPQVEFPDEARGDGGDAAREAPLQVDRVAPSSYSAREVFRTTDFAAFTEEELQRARRTIARLQWNFGIRRARRWRSGRGRSLDLRRALRRNIRYGGEILALPTRRRGEERRPIVFLCDVSGSMERYVRMLLYFLHGLASGTDRVDVFLFATRLTRVTRELVRRRPDQAVPAIPARLPDWGGGTRIGDALRTFNVRWARRVLGRGAVVLLISDGWDRGEPDRLRDEMARLQRSCHRLIWLNPLLGSPDYQPLTRGMQAALPFVDDFLPVHNLSSLEALAAHLARLPAERPPRTSRPSPFTSHLPPS